MIRKNTVKLSEVIRLYWKEHPEIYHQMMEARICRLWSETLGDAVAQCTTAVFVKNRILYVSLTSSVVRSELTAIRKQLIAKLNSQAGANVVDGIVIR